MTKGRFRKNSISSRLMVYFVCIVLLPVVVLSLIMHGVYKNSIMNMARNNARDSLELIDFNITQQFKKYDELAYFISRDRQLQNISEYIGNSEFDEDEIVRDNLSDLLDFYRTSASQVSKVLIAYENEIVFSTDRKDNLSCSQKDRNWYKKCKKEPKKGHVFNYSPNEEIYNGLSPQNTEIITVCRSIENKDGEFVGVISLEMYSQILERSMSNILARNGSYVYVVNSDNQVVYSPVVGTIQDVAEKDYCSETVYNEHNQWKIIGMVSMTAYVRQLNLLSSILIISLLVIAVVMAVISIKVGKSIVNPIETLQALMKEAENGDLSVRFSGKGTVEIQELGESFNIMIEQLDHNVKQVYIEQKAKRKAEMKALQANIKPHFLYNTLDTIHWMAKAYRATDIVETVDALSTLFRISLSKGSEIITVEQEIQHVTSYLQIQKIRYEDMISYDIYMEKDCRDLKVQKLILQPLVENAIYHGIKESGSVGTIKIRVWRDENAVYLTVEDDGMGMTQERLNYVRASLNNFVPEKGGAYGVVNVHQRIVLNYGQPYGLYLESEKDTGTTAVIYHPVI